MFQHDTVYLSHEIIHTCFHYPTNIPNFLMSKSFIVVHKKVNKAKCKHSSEFLLKGRGLTPWRAYSLPCVYISP